MTPADVTARLVAFRQMLGLAQRPRMVPREQPPIVIEAAYARQLVSVVNEWRAELAPLLADLPRLLAGIRRDDTQEGTAVRSSIARARTVANRTARVSEAARRSAREAADHQKRQIDRQMKAGLGTEIPTADRKVPTMIERFVEKNVADIESLGNKTLDDVQRLVIDAFDKGTSAEDLAQQISARFNVAESIARRIASNQLTRLTAQVRQARHQEIGIAVFRWKTRNDGKVRPSHAVKHDRFFPYEGSRRPSFMPGEEPG